MAGMCDNPLVGDYTKGISKGREYFVELDRRFRREKVNPKRFVSDLEMGLIREQAEFVARSKVLNFGGRFCDIALAKTQKHVPKSNPKVARKISPKSGLEDKICALQKHFRG